jgi:hypothetical protein
LAGLHTIVISSANTLGSRRDAKRSPLQASEWLVPQHLGGEAIKTSEHKPIEVFEDKPLRRSTPQDIELMAASLAA